MKEDIITIFREMLNESETKKNYTDEEKIKAAYALNMCMVSVSQIVDYDDLYILDQEYDGILNNLNLEMMPKDEALLSIIKQVLNTITFFRLEKGDKELIDKEYQYKMKNAIWSAIPNLGVVVTGGEPVAIAMSLASQVGIGYMNYRRAKAENALEYEKQMWQLQRSAMEQFQGLQRELFDTAWRLADTYQFPDEYRLTERQIKQYNSILMDSDEIRKYERLTTVRGYFKAYPPFWYYYGNTANHIARNERLEILQETRAYYRQKAKEHFETYWNQNQYALLREDMLASSCALEYVDLLDIREDREKIIKLLEEAVKYSGNANDVLQLCAVAYLKINELGKAAEILRILVNENYNQIVNAQILSSIYVHEAVCNNSSEAKRQYEILTTRMNAEYLYKLPETAEHVNIITLEKEFVERQKKLLLNKFEAVTGYLINEFGICLGKNIPVPDSMKGTSDFYFSIEGQNRRKKDIHEMFTSSFLKKEKTKYIAKLSQCDVVHDYFEVLNQFFGKVMELHCIKDRYKLQNKIEEIVRNHADDINVLVQKMEEKRIEESDVIQLLDWNSLNYFNLFIQELRGQIADSIAGMSDMYKCALADTKLREYCEEHCIPDPDEMINKGVDVQNNSEEIQDYFRTDLLNPKLSIGERNIYAEIETILRTYEEELDKISTKAKVYFHDEAEFNAYFENSKLKYHKDILQKTIAVYDDLGLQNVDILFTVDGLVPIIRNSIKNSIPYFSMISDDRKKCYQSIVETKVDKKEIGRLGIASMVLPGGVAMAVGGKVAFDMHAVDQVRKAMQPMFEEICETILRNGNR